MFLNQVTGKSKVDTPIKVKEGKKMYGKFDEYEIKNAARTLEEAEEIKANSEMMKHVEKCLKEKVASTKKAYKSISDMRADYKAMEDEEE